MSVETITELHRVLQRKGFQRYVTEEERMEFLAAYVRAGRLVEVTHRVNVCRDPQDDRFLELALSGRAACIVSGTKICYRYILSGEFPFCRRVNSWIGGWGI